MASTPIRQPRGPPGTASPGPPPPDAESILRRNKTVSTPRSNTDPQSVGFNNGAGDDTGGPSPVPVPVQGMPQRRSFGAANIDYAAAARQMRYGHGGGGGGFTVLSGAGTIGSTDGSLIRRASGRNDFVSRGTTEETLMESEASDEGPATELGVWGRSGLGRQSSLPSRKLNGVNPGLFTPADPPRSDGSMPPPPPRPPRRVYHPSIDQSASPPPPPGSHSRNRSLNMMVNTDVSYDPSSGSPVASTPGSAGHGSQAGAHQLNPAGVGRTQSLRSHMHQSPYSIDVSMLGRSASMRTPGELSYSRIPQSPPAQQPPFSLTTPPRNKRHLGGYDDDMPGATVRRHQSLTHDYGRGREPSQALLSLDQREDLRRRLAASPGAHSQHSSGTPVEGGAGGHSRQRSDIDGIGRNLWTPGATGDDGWNDAAAAQQLQEALDQLSLRDAAAGGQRPPHHPPQLGDEPSWVTNLVGMPGQPSPQPPQRQLWDDRGAGAPYGNYGNWAGGNMPAPLLFQQQQLYANQQAQLKIAAGLPVHPGVPLLPQPGYNYLGSPFTAGYPAPPASNMPVPAQVPLSAQDLDVIELARSKGLNPATFDCRPPAARFFVIKSYTEDDVQKSLKHGVWSSTVLGNKRLDTAYREFHDKGPIYLLFSVNGSRHFCGVARQTSPVDENKTSSIWAQDGKWRGLFTLSWIFVRDIPTSALRHIRLNNTPERKPITNSRDTQELEYDAGCEVLQIFLDWQHKAKTSLLQDFAYYERMSANREGDSGSGTPGGGQGGQGGQGGGGGAGNGRSGPSPGPGGHRRGPSPNPNAGGPNRSGPSPQPNSGGRTPNHRGQGGQGQGPGSQAQGQAQAPPTTSYNTTPATATSYNKNITPTSYNRPAYGGAKGQRV